MAAVWDLIGSTVHYAHFEKEHRLEDAILMFKTQGSSKLFLIMLIDCLSLLLPMGRLAWSSQQRKAALAKPISASRCALADAMRP